MKILESHQYVDLEKETEPFYQLRQISMWDLTPMQCFRRTEKYTFHYEVRLHTKVGKSQWKPEAVELTPEIIEELTKMGYIVPEKQTK